MTKYLILGYKFQVSFFTYLKLVLPMIEDTNKLDIDLRN